MTIPHFSEDWLLRGVAGRVSVVTPCFNVEPFIADAAGSVLEQTHDNLEWILADDGSTDGTRQKIEAIAKTDPRVRVLTSSRNVGPFALRNRALDISMGEYIAFLDADDVWRRTKLEKQIACFSLRPEAGLCHHYLMRMDADGTPTHRLQQRSERYDGRSFHAMIRRNGVATTSVLVRRHVFAEVGGFDEAFRFRGDWEMWTRIAQATPFAFVPEELGFYRIRPGNISSMTRTIRPYAFAVLDKFERDYGLSPYEIDRYVAPARTGLHSEYGIMALMDRDYRAARRDLMAAIKREPLDKRAWTSFVKTLIYPPFRPGRPA